MIGKKINQLATELAPVSTDLTIIGDPISGVSKKITLAQLGAIFSGAVSFYTDLASFPATGDINVIYCAKDTQKLYLWSGSAYTEVFPSQALLDTYQLRSEKGNANGYASLDSGGKVPISQLPSSIMEYKGTWNAATNTPTLANGTGDTGDVYICNVAGTVNFGAGPITFAVGDYVIYSGSIWQRSSGAVGTVTSVAATITGDSLTISGSPVTTSGTLALAFSGTTSQYIRGNGTLETFPTLTGFVPYTGATANVDLGTHTLLAKNLVINHSSGSGVAASITKGGSGEALTVVKSSGSGNAASITGGVTLLSELHLTTDLADAYIASATNWNAAYNDKINSAAVTGTTTKTLTLTQQDGGTITASWTDDNTDAVTSVFGRTGAVVATSGDYNTSQVTENTNLYFTNARAIASTLTGYTSGAGTITSSDSILSAIQKLNGNIGALTTGVSSVNGLTGAVTLTTSNIAEGTNLYYTEARVNANTNVAANTAARHNAVTLGTANGLSLSTQVLSLGLASTSTTGALSSTDWNTFNNKQNALTNPVTGTGTTNYLPKFTGTSTIGNSQVFDNGTNVGIGTTSNLSGKLTVNGGFAIGNGWGTSGATLEASTGATGADGATIEVSYWGTSSYGSLFLKTGNAIRATLNASGNLGLGVTPSAWASGGGNLQLKDGVNISWSGASGYLASNQFFNGTSSIYISNGAATQYAQEYGIHKWLIAPVGTAGNAISFTQAMTLNASGFLGIGETNPTSKLHIQSSASGGQNIRVVTSVAAGRNYMQFANGSGDMGYMGYGGADSKFYINNQLADDMLFVNNGATRLTIASTGAATFSSSSAGLGNYQLTVTDGTKSIKFGASTSGAEIQSIGSIPLYINYSGNNTLLNTTAGNVGIGTTAPTAPLTVAGTTDLAWSASTSKLQISRSGTVARLQNYDNGSAASLALQWEGGNVGIGTTSPSVKLHVNGQQYLGTASSTTGQLYLFNSGNDTRFDILNNGSEFKFAATYLTSAGYMPITFYTGDTERMRITSGGALCIGRTTAYSAGYLLNVEGNIYASAQLECGTSIQTGAPTNGTARQWKLGDARSGGISTDSYIIVEINGTTYSIPALNGLP